MISRRLPPSYAYGLARHLCDLAERLLAGERCKPCTGTGRRWVRGQQRGETDCIPCGGTGRIVEQQARERFVREAGALLSGRQPRMRPTRTASVDGRQVFGQAVERMEREHG